MKVAQLLATIPNALPPGICRASWRSLQANAPPMGWPFVKRRMAGELGPDWERRFNELRARGGARRLARPGASRRRPRRTAARLQAAISRHGRRRSRPICSSSRSCWRFTSATTAPSTTDEIHAEIADRLREELDYEREAGAHAALSPACSPTSPRSHVPGAVGRAVDASRLLTMTWLEGAPLLDAAKATAGDAQRASPATCSAPGTCRFYYYGVIHGDPHLGNYTVRPDRSASTCWISAASAIFRRDFVKGVIDLYRALDRDDEALAVARL